MKLQEIIDAINILDSIVTEDFYIIDILNKRLLHVSNSPLLLGFYTQKEALSLGYNFLRERVFQDDKPLQANIFEIMKNYMKTATDDIIENIDYFSYAIRLQLNVKSIAKPIPVMTFHKMKPFVASEKELYFICSLRNSILKETETLRMYYCNGLEYDVCNLANGVWKKHVLKIELSQQEKNVLLLAMEGYNNTEIADKLCIGLQTVKNHNFNICQKCNVHSIAHAIIFAVNHNII